MAKILKPRTRRPIKAENQPKPENRPAPKDQGPARDRDR